MFLINYIKSFTSRKSKEEEEENVMAPPQEGPTLRNSPLNRYSPPTKYYDTNSNYTQISLMKPEPLELPSSKNPAFINMPKQAGFNRVLDGLKKRQLLHDFRLERAADVYNPIQNIGSGAFGIVCEAEETSSRTRVAIKKIAHASATPTLARRTLREIRVLRHIKHNNIVRLRDIFRTNGPLGIDVFLVMDLMSINLHQVIYSWECLKEEDILSFLMQLLNGLQYLHKASIAHRDLKPSNLLVDENLNLQIADFGMAKCYHKEALRADDPDEHCFYMTQHVATLPYRAPELLYVLPEHSTAVDMWAVGCIFGEMVLKSEVFPGRNVQNQIRMLLAVFGRPPQHIINEVRCDRTRKLIEDADNFVELTWEEFLFNKNRSENQNIFENCEAVSFIRQLFEVDANDRLTIDEALNHPYIKNHPKAEKSYLNNTSTCPFYIKHSMIQVEKLNHAKLIEELQKDAPSATHQELHSGTRKWFEGAFLRESDIYKNCGEGFQEDESNLEEYQLQISVCTSED
ncbi:unnamed protein product [Caenorhabditis angaria]|uniref:Protein kinase domain-containing protein n=1 Tax=Caenorhabditis angaria TaxID=860376 RepID=A0A9P1J4X4_9PELO|nr:unnamed protein product [Caenorhabditis angaria]